MHPQSVSTNLDDRRSKWDRRFYSIENHQKQRTSPTVTRRLHVREDSTSLEAFGVVTGSRCFAFWHGQFPHSYTSYHFRK